MPKSKLNNTLKTEMIAGDLYCKLCHKRLISGRYNRYPIVHNCIDGYTYHVVWPNERATFTPKPKPKPEKEIVRGMVVYKNDI